MTCSGSNSGLLLSSKKHQMHLKHNWLNRSRLKIVLTIGTFIWSSRTHLTPLWIRNENSVCEICFDGHIRYVVVYICQYLHVPFIVCIFQVYKDIMTHCISFGSKQMVCNQRYIIQRDFNKVCAGLRKHYKNILAQLAIINTHKH